MFETNRLIMTSASPDDVAYIMELEQHPENRNFVWQGSQADHLAEIDDPNQLLLLIKRKKTNQTIGYILIRLDRHSKVFELRRIVLAEKGNGYGWESMLGIIEFAFESMDTNRFWLDVYPDNQIGIALYEKMGLHRDGVLRQNYRAERGYLDQIVYSLLRQEYPSWKISHKNI